MALPLMTFCNYEELQTGAWRICQLRGYDIKVHNSGLEKIRISLKDLTNVEMQERNFTIDTHRYDFIICLKSDQDVVYLRANTKQEMEDWYRALRVPLQALGWIENDSCIQPGNGITRKCKSVKSRKPPTVEQRQPKSISVHEMEGVFQRRLDISISAAEKSTGSNLYVNTTLPGHDEEQSIMTHSSLSSNSTEGSTSSTSMESSSTDEISQQSVYYQNGVPSKIPIPCTSLQSKQQETDVYEVRLEELNKHECSANRPDNQYTDLDFERQVGVPYEDHIVNAGMAAQCRRSMRKSRGNTLQSRNSSGLQHKPEPEVKLRIPTCDAPKSLRSRENSTYNVLQLQHDSRGSSASFESLYLPPPPPNTSLSGCDMPKPLRSKENIYYDPPSYNESCKTPSYYFQPFEPAGQRPSDQHHPHPVAADLRHASSYRTTSNTDRSSSPPLPARDGITNHASLRRFVECQRQNHVIITLDESDLQGGKRLHLAKIQGSIYICSWESTGGTALEQQLHPGDELLKVNDIKVRDRDIKFIYNVLSSLDITKICLTVRRAPHAIATIVYRTPPDQELGIKVENNIIKHIISAGAFGSSTNLGRQTTGVINAGTLVDWAITEINWQPVNLYANTKEVVRLLQKGRNEVALVVQPSDLVHAMKEAAMLCSRCGTTSSPPSSPKCANCRLSFKS